MGSRCLHMLISWAQCFKLSYFPWCYCTRRSCLSHWSDSYSQCRHLCQLCRSNQLRTSIYFSGKCGSLDPVPFKFQVAQIKCFSAPLASLLWGSQIRGHPLNKLCIGYPSGSVVQKKVSYCSKFTT